MATNISVARSGSLCPEADLAAQLASGGLEEARRIRADLRHLLLGDLAAEPGETSIAVDDKPNPFTTPAIADQYLRPAGSPGNVIALRVPGPDSWDQHASYAAARAFSAVSQTGTVALPALAVFGDGDGLNPDERARQVRACLHDRRPFALISPIEDITRFLAIDSDDCNACAAIVARNLQHVAMSVATGSAVAVGTHHTALVQRDGGPWIPAADLPQLPVLHASVAAPASTLTHDGPQNGTLFPESGNRIVLNGVVLGGVGAAYQPQGGPCDSAAIYIAAAAGRTIVRAGTGKLLTSPYQVQALLINALLKGAQVPALIAARDELAARRLLKHLRLSGTA